MERRHGEERSGPLSVGGFKFSMRRAHFTLLSSWQLCWVWPQYQSPHFEQPETARPKVRINKAFANTRMNELQVSAIVLMHD